MPTKTIVVKKDCSIESAKEFDEQCNDFEKKLKGMDFTFTASADIANSKQNSCTILTGFFHYHGDELVD